MTSGARTDINLTTLDGYISEIACMCTIRVKLLIRLRSWDKNADNTNGIPSDASIAALVTLAAVSVLNSTLS